ncbi:MAG: class I SAM-dependent methyltransferase [Chloroflexi bacterium]|nr:class I SAM-dependent methyltransferase [Chloroflexota bacterium]
MPVNYDKAVSFYDATRGYRAGVVERYRDALLECADASVSARMLELGIGSGLIARPFIDAAQDYVGIDLSRGMMRLIAGKVEAGCDLRLAQADCAKLPFAAGRFDLVHAVRVFHHLHEWRACIDEARRLLRAGGVLAIVENIAPADAELAPWGIVQEKWDQILRGLGVGGEGIRHGIWMTDDRMRRYLLATGARAKTVDLLRYVEKPVSPRIMVERRAAGMFSSDWRLPPAIHGEAVRALQDWLERECAAPDEIAEREMLFRALVARW